MASGTELSLDIPAAQELRFVDHVESKIVSPDKECISPTKSPVKNKFPSDSLSSAKESDIIDPNKSKNSDSGLDSSDTSAELGNESFVDRLEKHTNEAELEQLISPTKSNCNVLPNVNDTLQTLDAINNNEESATNDVTSDRTEVVKKDIYLGKEVCLHDNGNVETKVEIVKERHVSETSMNLYWYSSSLNVDLEELEAFKDSQNDSATSNVQINVGNDYYHSKNKDSEKVNENGNTYKSEANFDIKLSPVNRENWSPAFESASSRILDLASELKTEPKGQNGVAKEEAKVPENKEKHPWGLDSESRVITELVVEKSDELPEISELNDKNIAMSQELVVGAYDETDATGMMEWKTSATRVEDAVDAVGYMELKDKPKQCDDKKKEYKQKKENDRKDEKSTKNVDEADAVGYMELKDRPLVPVEEQIIASSDQTVLKTGKVNATATKTTPEAQSINISEIQGQIMQMETEKKEGLDDTDSTISIEQVVEVKEGKKVEAKFDPFTVKRTYLIDEKTDATVQKMGGLFIDSQKLIDEYLDDKNYSLTLKDSWLRLRNKKFEMKLNSALSGCGPNKTYNTEMIDNENEILEVLMNMYQKKLEQKRRVSERQLDVLIDALNITEFVTFETTRKRYQMDGFTITLDLTNFGYQVGEIEVVAGSSNEMTDGLKKMDALASKLGLRPLQSN
ncbi:hypothetical protein ACF0H5_005709 [Mactra antiquata]